MDCLGVRALVTQPGQPVVCHLTQLSGGVGSRAGTLWFQAGGWPGGKTRVRLAETVRHSGGSGHGGAFLLTSAPSESRGWEPDPDVPCVQVS